MAFTVSNVVNSVMGAHRLNIFRVTADSAAGAIDTGLNAITLASLSVEKNGTAAATAPVLAFNAGTTGTSIAGTFALTGCVANGIYTVWVVSPA